jgi:hypothetical protein
MRRADKMRQVEISLPHMGLKNGYVRIGPLKIWFVHQRPMAFQWSWKKPPTVMNYPHKMPYIQQALDKIDGGSVETRLSEDEFSLRLHRMIVKAGRYIAGDDGDE